MCETCGCGQPDDEVIITKPGEEKHQHIHLHEDDHEHKHKIGQHHHHESHHEEEPHSHSHGRIINLQTDILQKNNLIAERNRGYFEAKNIFAINIVSSPGSGKTCLLERTIHELKNQIDFFVIEGDQQTMNDAEKIKAAGGSAVQINTGTRCHLDAEMINQALKKLDPENNSAVIIENVGNLVCPSLFNLGETKRVIIISVTEGEDKPIKYPTMFESSNLCIINKIDLLPYVDFDVDKTKQYALQVNHHLEFIQLSAKTGEGCGEWYEWLKSHSKIKQL